MFLRCSLGLYSAVSLASLGTEPVHSALSKSVYLLAASAVHSAFNETEGAADFVFLRLSLGRNNVFIPSLFIDSRGEKYRRLSR